MANKLLQKGQKEKDGEGLKILGGSVSVYFICVIDITPQENLNRITSTPSVMILCSQIRYR